MAAEDMWNGKAQVAVMGIACAKDLVAGTGRFLTGSPVFSALSLCWSHNARLGHPSLQLSTHP